MGFERDAGGLGEGLSEGLRAGEGHEPSRRAFLRQMTASAALPACFANGVRGDGTYRTHAARAKRVIYLHMAGSPPQHDLFDYKPALARYDGSACPSEYLQGERFAFIKGHPKILASPFAFAQHGASGAWVSELLPHFARVVDKTCIVRSMWTDQFNHAPAQLFLQTGSPLLGRPSIGSWVLYALGSENRDLPGFVVLQSGGRQPSAGKSVWGSGFLPSLYQGVPLRSSGEAVFYLDSPPGVDARARERAVRTMRALDELRHGEHGHAETLARVEQRELAVLMQSSIPAVCDLRREPDWAHELYGTRGGADRDFARNCLLARRLVESGVRFVQLYDWGWDTHGTGPNDDLLHQLPKKALQVDQAIAALLSDLEQRGLLEETLVVWGGEFGRTPLNEERNGSKFYGRDHHPHAFTMWLAGGGARPGAIVGESDELGYRVSRDPVHVHDFQATLLHLLGIEHKALLYRYFGRDFRLTDVAGTLRPALLA